MVLVWPTEILGTPPPAWNWYTSSELDKRDTSFKLDSADALIMELLRTLEYRELVKDDLVSAIRESLAELGVLSEKYPVPVANVVKLLSETLDTL